MLPVLAPVFTHEIVTNSQDCTVPASLRLYEGFSRPTESLRSSPLAALGSGRCEALSAAVIPGRCS